MKLTKQQEYFKSNMLYAFYYSNYYKELNDKSNHEGWNESYWFWRSKLMILLCDNKKIEKILIRKRNWQNVIKDV